MKKIVVALISWGLLISGVAVANALTIGGYGVAGYYVEYGPETTDWTTSLTLNQFDSSLGTLVKIELFLSGSETSTATVEAPDGSSATWKSVSVATDITLYNPTDNSTQLLLVTPEVENTNGSVAAGETYNLKGSGSDSKDTELTSADSAFSLFIGSGTISLATSASTFGSTTNLSSGAEFSPTGSASVYLYVVYTYEPASSVPEPATMLLFGAGLAGVAAVSRRKMA